MTRTLKEVGQAVRERRDAIPLTVREAAAIAGVSDTTWGNVESGKPSNRRTRLGVCRALGWSDDSFDRLLAGEDPAEAAEAADQSPAVSDDLRTAVRELTEAVRELRADLRAGRR